ncbi:MAG: hypothetical protein CME64_08410 [Halobacteriovoraceae bacterium]|nr:hypothetical protein [Halobacteriovoraceae bacterium]
MKKMTIKTQVLLFAFFLLSIKVSIGLIGHSSLVNVQENLRSVFKTRLPTVELLSQADRDFQQALVAERSLLLSGLSSDKRKELAAEYFENRQQVIDRFNAYQKLGSSEGEKKLSAEFVEKFEIWKTLSNSKLGLNEQGKFAATNNLEEAALESFNLSAAFEAARDKLDKLQDTVGELGEREFLSGKSSFKNAETFMVSFLLIGVLVALFAAFLLTRSVSNKLTTIAKALGNGNLDLTKMSGDLRERATSLASASREQASSVTETSSSLHEISKMVEGNAKHAENSTVLVNESNQVIQKGIRTVEELRDMIQRVDQASDKLAGSVEKNNKDLEKIIAVFVEIKNKTNVINDIVFQTKLLSFNASVEAARAGAHGKGFSVVAEEIGNLAKVSGRSAKEITDLLEDSLTQVNKLVESSQEGLQKSLGENKNQINQSVQISEKAQEAFEEISEKFRIVQSSSQEVAEASREQQSGVNEINLAMQEISSTISVANQSSKEVEVSSVKLKSMVDMIAENIKALEAIVGLKPQRVVEKTPEQKQSTTNAQIDEEEDRFEDWAA